MQLDKITEAIAHFIGLFQTDTEQARLRDDYLQFKALQAIDAADEQHTPDQVSFQTPYALDNPDPGIHYVPAPTVLVPEKVGSGVGYPTPNIPVPLDLPSVAPPQYIAPYLPAFHHVGGGTAELAPPGSVAVHVAQINNLSDNDFAAINTGPVEFHPIGTPTLALESLIGDAAQFSPIGEASFGSAEDIGAFVANTAASLSAFAAAIEAAKASGTDYVSPLSSGEGVTVHVDVTVVDGPDSGSIYVNGQLADSAPKFDDVIPVNSPLAKNVAETPTDSTPGGNHMTQGVGSVATPGSAQGGGQLSAASSVELTAGGNTLINNAFLVNDALEGNVFAVAGNHFSLNAIIQVNAWSDSDSLGASLAGWGGASHNAPTSAFNIAEMQRIETDNTSAGSGGNASLSFPKAWAVTEIHGDFISLNWVQQFNFVMDNDTAVVASASGVTTKVGMGDNQALNSLSLADLGRHFDLILIGGNYYDANIITQTNVLLDDDVVGALAGFHTSGQGTVSTGDNLLWNNANITSIGYGGAETLPNGFQQTLDHFAAGNKTLTADVLNDSAFQGLSGIKVLYISGSVYDLQYVSQTNVLGDADHIALALNSAKGGVDADWSIVTGSNVLANSAKIVDVDPAGKIYFGGSHYSDELLVQTDIIRTDHLLEGKDGDHLVNEAVAFLSDDMLKTDPEGQTWNPKDDLAVHPAHSDIMQSVLS